MKFYFVGQVSMANRGCEALIRSNTQLVREKYPEARLLCPSEDVALDSKQWQDAATAGVDFVPVPKFPFALKLWGRIIKAMPGLRSLGVVPLTLDPATRRAFQESDAILMTGGDIISLEYGLPSLYFWSGIMDAAHRLGRPTHLLAASVGPFSRDPVLERQMVAHLRRYTTITVRESASLTYLEGLGLKNVGLVTDPAFIMTSQPWDVSGTLEEGRDTIGLNFSPLVRKFRQDDASRAEFDAGIKSFIRSVVTQTQDNVLLVPHVDPLTGQHDNSDRAYMASLLADLGDLGDRVRMTPDLLNAAQIKYVLGRCRYFIGARTHATVGAISQSVPTCSIAYSVKAVGINKDLFGSTKYVLPTPDVTAQSLGDALATLRADEAMIKQQLAEKLPLWKQRARLSIAGL
jgi:colanic acid/amylovoran biosynthesis protein